MFEAISDLDAMLVDRSSASIDRYFRVGASALDIIKTSLSAAGSADPRRILDLPCGAGRVTRWLRKEYPDAEIYACDTSLGEMEFCVSNFSCVGVPPNDDISMYNLPQSLDLIWCGSLITHLSDLRAVQLLEKFAENLSKGGVMVFTTHGRPRIAQLLKGSKAGVDNGSLSGVMDDYHRLGYGYAGYKHGSNYGFSLTSLSWICRWVETRQDLSLVVLQEGGWVDRQDVTALKKI